MIKQGNGKRSYEFLTEHQIRESIILNMKDAVVITDNKAVVEMINPGFTRLFGYTEEEALGKPLSELITQDHSREDLRGSGYCSPDDLKSRCKKMMCIKNGRTIGVISRITPIMMDNETIGSFAFYREVY